MQARLKKVSILIPAVMLPLGIWLGYRTFRGRSFADVWETIVGLPSANLALAFACAAASYLCLTGFDTLAVRYVGRPLPYRKIALTSFVSLGIGHTVGFAVLSSGALRYRFYSGFGVTAGDVARIMLFCAVTVGLGLISLTGVILLARPDLGLGAIGWAPAVARAIGLLCVAIVGLYVLLAWRRRKPFSIRGHAFSMPGVPIATAQIAIGTVNFAFVAATLYFLLADAASYAQTVAAYVLGNVSALISHVPGGIGVFEFVISKLVSHGDIFAALIAFRIVYFIVPLVLAMTLLVATELRRWCKS